MSQYAQINLNLLDSLILIPEEGMFGVLGLERWKMCG